MEFFLFSQVACIMPRIDQLFAYLLHIFSLILERVAYIGYVLFICLLFYQFHSLKNTFYSSFCRPKKNLCAEEWINQFSVVENGIDSNSASGNKWKLDLIKNQKD